MIFHTLSACLHDLFLQVPPPPLAIDEGSRHPVSPENLREAAELRRARWQVEKEGVKKLAYGES